MARERADQLRKIAKVRGLSIAELITKYIASEIQAGTIDDELPGFGVVIRDGLVELNIQGKAIKLTKKETFEIAADLENPTGWCRELENGLLFEVSPRGRGFVLRFIEKKELFAWRRERSAAPWIRQGLNKTTAKYLVEVLRRAAS